MVEQHGPRVTRLQVAEEQQHRRRRDQRDHVGAGGLGDRVLQDAALLAPLRLVTESGLEHDSVRDQQRRRHDREQGGWR